MSSGALRAKRKKKYTAEAIVKDFKKHKVAYALSLIHISVPSSIWQA